MRYSFLFFIVFSTLRFYSQWSANVASNTPVCVLPKTQQNVHLVPDDNNGSILCWQDNRTSSVTSSDIYAQRINASGFAKWVLNGVAICSNAATQSAPAITNAGSGSAIIVWEDFRNGNYDIYAQKIDSSGNILWAADGVPVCTKATNQKGPHVVDDGAGGAIIVWEDSLNFYWDIYAQRISSSGTAMWATNGVVVCTALNTQNNPRIDYGPTNGAIITWQDKRNNNDYDIYAQSLDANGVSQWTSNGLAICTAINTQSNPKIEPDGSGGAIIGWEDKRNGLDYNIYGQRVSANGTTSWATNGLAVVTAAANQSALDMKLFGTNVCFSWKDIRNGNYAVYTQLMSLGGTAVLPANGVQLSAALKSINPNTVADGLGGVIVAWQDSTAAGWNISSQKLSASGQAQWTSGGVVVSSATDDQVDVVQASDNAGGAIYAWIDHRNGTDYDIYCQKISSSGTMTDIREQPAGEWFSVLCYPNPVLGAGIIKVSGIGNNEWTVSVFDALGNKIECETLKGNEAFHVNTSLYSKGVYFYNVTVPAEQKTASGKFISLAND